MLITFIIFEVIVILFGIRERWSVPGFVGPMFFWGIVSGFVYLIGSVLWIVLYDLLTKIVLPAMRENPLMTILVWAAILYGIRSIWMMATSATRAASDEIHRHLEHQESR